MNADVKKESPIKAFRRARAKKLRGETTSAETRLWKALKAVPMVGSHFRRQVPIGPYIADFACLSAKLIIEVDGPSHTTDKGVRHDEVRVRFLEREGFRVLRFWNADVYGNSTGVIDTIYAALYGSLLAPVAAFGHPTPDLRSDPPPQGEGGPSPKRERGE